MRVAILGTGRMGAPMARSMRRAGLDVAAWNRTRDKAEALHDDGVHIVGTVGGAVRDAEVVITMVYDLDSVLAITEELTGALADGAVWLQSATVGPAGMARIAAAAGDVGLVDAPVLGTVKPAQEGTLVPLVAGDDALIDAARPVLEAIGSKTIVAGDRLGAASALKLACNAWVLSITAATAQSVALARGLDVDPRLFLTAIADGATDSPYAQLKGTAMITDDLAASFSLDAGRKDLDLIAAAAAEAGVPTELTDALAAIYGRASAEGHGDDDLAAVIHGFG